MNIFFPNQIFMKKDICRSSFYNHYGICLVECLLWYFTLTLRGEIICDQYAIKWVILLMYLIYHKTHINQNLTLVQKRKCSKAVGNKASSFKPLTTISSLFIFFGWWRWGLGWKVGWWGGGIVLGGGGNCVIIKQKFCMIQKFFSLLLTRIFTKYQQKKEIWKEDTIKLYCATSSTLHGLFDRILLILK